MSRVYQLSLCVLALVFLGAGCVSSSNTSTTSGPAGMFVSTDKGETWKSISLLPTTEGVQQLSGVSVFRLEADPQDASALYWATRANGLFFSYDDGKGWQHAPAPLDTGFVYSIAVHPKDPCTIYATNGNFVYKTIDCSRSWTEVYRELRKDVRVAALTYEYSSPYRVFVSLTNGDILKSADLGMSWQVVKRFKTPMTHIVGDKLQQGVIYAVSRKDGLYRSVDGGTTWTSLKAGLEEYSQALTYRRLVFHPTLPGVLYWISTYGVLVSNDSGTSWEPMNLITPPGSVDIFAFAINPDNDNEMYYTATSNNRSTFYRTNDGGQNWTTQRLPSNQVPTILRVHPKNTNWIYLGFTIPPNT
jgi:photosystem II stability/assembly factor-like uncharacterized protein